MLNATRQGNMVGFLGIEYYSYRSRTLGS